MLPYAIRRHLLVAGLLLAAAAVLPPAGAAAADLEPETANAYAHYVQVTESRRQHQERAGKFFYFQTLDAARRGQVLQQAKAGGIPVIEIETKNSAGQSLDIPDGMVNHWEGIMFIPGAKVADVVEVLQDYNRYPDIYKPRMVRAKLLSHQGDDYRVYVRVVQSSPWVTPVFNINLDVRYLQPGASREVVVTHSTRIAQVEDAGQPDEHEDSVGHDGGYMWRFDSYWRLEERDGGVMAEWESLVLSRQIPFIVRWFVRPFVNRLARQTVQDMMATTRDAVKKRLASASHK